MSITEKVQSDITTAMKAGDRRRATALRMVLSQLQMGKKEADGDFGEQQELAVLATEKKRRLQAAEAFRDGGREDSARSEEEEAEMIGAYMPEALGEEELDAIIAEAISSTGAAGIRDMGRVMSEVMPKTGGRADGKMVSARVKQALSG